MRSDSEEHFFYVNIADQEAPNQYWEAKVHLFLCYQVQVPLASPEGGFKNRNEGMKPGTT
jgi:hypothetical protein